MEKQQTAVSVENIRERYFGAVKKQSPALLARAKELTPSARYVVSQAKKRIGEKIALAGPGRPDEDDLLRLVNHVEIIEGEQLSERERTAVVASLSASLDHYDILSPLIENTEVNDIIVRSFRDVSIQIGRKNIQTDLQFPSKEAYKAFVENLLKRAGKACTLSTPVVDVALDQHIRVCVTHESFSPVGSGPMLTLRIARHGRISLEGLTVKELAPREILDYLAALVCSGNATLLIAGEVGTGKTTLLKALASRIHEDEAILIIEDTHELVLNRPFVRTLLTREANTEGAGRITPAQAIRTGMRMAMNRVILGEMRDGESAESFIDVCASGHAGMSTIHARSARDALSRLELFLSRVQGNVNIETVRRQIANAISAVVYLALDKVHHKRRIMNVVEVGTASDGAVQLSPMFSYAPAGEFAEWMRESGISFFADTLGEQDVELPTFGTRLSFEPESMYDGAFR
jgi:pilus assembly protein CpaF